MVGIGLQPASCRSNRAQQKVSRFIVLLIMRVHVYGCTGNVRRVGQPADGGDVAGAIGEFRLELESVFETFAELMGKVFQPSCGEAMARDLPCHQKRRKTAIKKSFTSSVKHVFLY